MVRQISITPHDGSQVTVELTDPESITNAVEALVAVNEVEAAIALLEEAERLYGMGIVLYAVFDMDVSNSMVDAGLFRSVQRQLPLMLRPVVGEVPVEVLVRFVAYGDLEDGDKMTTWDFKPLWEITRREWPHEGGGSPNYESHLEALMLSIGIRLLREGELRQGSEPLGPLPEGGVEIFLVTDDEEPRQVRITLKEAKHQLPQSCRLTVIADSSMEEFWTKGLLRPKIGDRFIPISSEISGLLPPLQDAITETVVDRADQTLALIAKQVQGKVAGLLTAGA